MAFEKHEVEDYEKKRYRGWDQKLVHSRENRLLERLLETVGSHPGQALDLPCGYGRFSGLLSKKGFTSINCDLSFFMVERANARRQLGNASPSPGVVADAVKGLPFKDESFFLVFSMRFFPSSPRKLRPGKNPWGIPSGFGKVAARFLLSDQCPSPLTEEITPKSEKEPHADKNDFRRRLQR